MPLFRRHRNLALAAILMVSAANLAAQSPLEVIRTSNQQILDIYASHQTIDQKIEQEIYRIMESVTDFDAISQRTIERFCRDLTSEECREFDRTFQELLRISSIKKLGRYRADRFNYLGAEVRGNQAVVKTIAFYKEDAYQLDYQLERIEDRWQIVNYVVDGVNTIRNYTKQFLRLLKKETFPELMQRLKNKIKEYQDENQEEQS